MRRKNFEENRELLGKKKNDNKRKNTSKTEESKINKKKIERFVLSTLFLGCGLFVVKHNYLQKTSSKKNRRENNQGLFVLEKREGGNSFQERGKRK